MPVLAGMSDSKHPDLYYFYILNLHDYDIFFCLVLHFLLIGYCNYVPTAAPEVLTAFTATVLNLQNTTFHTPSLVLTILLGKTYLGYQ